MYLIDKHGNRLVRIPPTSFGEHGFRERAHLQEWIAKDPSVLGEDLLIIQKEFAGFGDTNERLDLLALDRQGDLVIIENKLDDSGRDVTWQALKYASYCSTLTKDEIKAIYQRYLGEGAVAEERLTAFFGGRDYEEMELNSGLNQRIILIAANFRKEVTSTVLWLLNHNVRVQCFRVKPYSLESRQLLTFEQIIPMPDAGDYVVRMAQKSQEEGAAKVAQQARKNTYRAFWERLIKAMNERSDLFQSINALDDYYIAAGSGVGSVSYNFVATRDHVRAELWLARRPEDNRRLFEALHRRSAEIENAFGGPLNWDFKEGRGAQRIATSYPADAFDEEQWPGLIEVLVDAMCRLVDATRQPLLEAARKDHPPNPTP